MIILKILTFSYTLLSVGRPSRKTSAIRAYHDEEKIPRKRFHLQDTTKTSIKTMEISSLLNTDLGNWNELDLKESSLYTGAQPKIFQGRGVFVGLEHFFINILLKTPGKKTPQGKIWEFFLLDTLKLHFDWSLKDRHNQGIFYKIRVLFFWFSK